MARPVSVQITRHWRVDGSTTFALRARISGRDETVPLGNTKEGWDENRAERARRQLLAKLELGLWSPGTSAARAGSDEEPTFAELATDWLADRKLNPAIRPATTADDRWRLTRYLIPFFGELRPSQITPLKVKQYRRGIHEENEQIRVARAAGRPLPDPRSGQSLRPLSNESINKTLRTLAAVLDEAEDAGWVTRNVARGRRMREPVERHRRDALELDEFVGLWEAADQLDRPHKPATFVRAAQAQALRDREQLSWHEIAARLGVARSTAAYLYDCHWSDGPQIGPRRAVIATLGFAGLRVSELCALDRQDVDLTKGKIYIRDAKTPAGIRVVDIRPRLLDQLRGYAVAIGALGMSDPFVPTRTGARRDRNNVLNRVVAPVFNRANELRAERGQAPIVTHVTPHTFRRTYITYMLAAGFDLPYVQDQVGHSDPATTLAIYATVIRRPDRDALRGELRALFGEERAARSATVQPLHDRIITSRAHEREALER
jgi:integrase